jgi:hypothetical protein
MPKLRIKKLKSRDEILLRHITTGKIGCGPHKSKIKYDRRLSKLEIKNIAAEEQNGRV